MIYEITEKEVAEGIFSGWNETIIWSCLQGVMGHIYADNIENPTSAMAILGDFCFFAGKPSEELVAFKPAWCGQDFIIAVGQSHQWGKLIETYYGTRAKKVVRYAMKKEQDIFDKNELKRIVSQLAPAYTINPIGEADYLACKKEVWSRDLVSQFSDWQTYEKYGVGVVIKSDGVIVSGASSYSAYLEGIEIEIDTQEEYRRRGFAYICSAMLILKCLERGLYPSWDAQNLWSVALAEKLGYHFDYEYDAYEIYGY